MTRLARKFYYHFYLLLMGTHFEFASSIRRFCLRNLLGQELRGLLVRQHVYISGVEGLRIGAYVSLNQFCFLSCEGGLRIGDYVSIGHGTSVVTTSHSYDSPDVPIKCQPISERPVVIGSDVWIGANVTILGGVSIADGTIVAAGAVVTNSVKVPNTIIGGIPARHIKDRFEPDA